RSGRDRAEGHRPGGLARVPRDRPPVGRGCSRPVRAAARPPGGAARGRAAPPDPPPRGAAGRGRPGAPKRPTGGARRGGVGAAACARLIAVPGMGPWTAAEVAVRALGDPDAVSVGDFHLPNIVAWTLAGEPRADDGRMLELLEPWRGQRARVVRLLELSGLQPPAYGPKYAARSIAPIRRAPTLPPAPPTPTRP